MNLFRIVIELFALYLLYKVIFDFIIPLISTTKQVKKQFTAMNAQMQQNSRQQTEQSSAKPSNTAQKLPSSKDKSDDYIDFEEVK